MKQALTAEILANEICMLRTQYNGCFLVVEGATDARFFKNLTDEKTCNVMHALGKEGAITTVEEVIRRNLAGILAIVDADFDHLNAMAGNNDNVLFTDTHDVETMIFQSPALEKLLYEFGSTDKLHALTEDVRLIVLRGAVRLGFLRYISQRDALSLKFQDISFDKFVNKDTLMVDIHQMVTAVKNHSQKFELDVEKVVAQIEELERQAHDPWQVSCGHDTVFILSMGLRKLLGNRQPNEVRSEHLEICLRLSYDYRFFVATVLFQKIRKWESENLGYTVLREAS